MTAFMKLGRVLVKWSAGALLVTVSLFFGGFVSAQSFPNKPVRIIVPFGTGGPDSLARLLGVQLTQQMGQSFVIENKPGANGILGAEALAKSAPDGYTLMITSAGFVAAPSMYKSCPTTLKRTSPPLPTCWRTLAFS